MVHFDAVRAPLRSRAKWRAVRVWKTDDNDLLQQVMISTSAASSQHTLYNCGGGGSGQSGFDSCPSNGLSCLPFLATPVRCKSKSSVGSTSSFHFVGSSSSATVKQRRCHSLDRLDYETTSQFHNNGKFLNDDYSAFYLSDEDDLNIDLGPTKDSGEDDYLSFLAYDTLKRPIKLLHNTGGILPDLEFPDSDISSWAPGEADNVSLMNGHQDKTTCNASTQTWFTGVITSAEFYHGPTCTHEQLQVVGE
ncbi:unnamed protein product [Mesocestoides corti]|uniref:MAM domain-containing protein n=1 Tax=Mesocestoides corti TaxID=53468 RepID=A0A0R3UEI7_MESCO|nr:unnamed protein product [Mesocestoides corti]